MDLSGDWRLHVTFLLGQATHALHLQQEGEQVRGRFRSQYGEQEIHGRADADGSLELRSGVHFQACGAPMNFRGRASGDRMEGQVNLGEFWTASWRAERLPPR